MNEFKYPKWMNVFPCGLSLIIGLIGASAGNTFILIIGIPIGAIVGFGIISILTKYKN